MTFDDHASFGQAKMEDIGGRALPKADTGESSNNEIFSQVKLEDIGGRSLPKQDEGSSTISFVDKGDVDNMGKFPSKD